MSDTSLLQRTDIAATETASPAAKRTRILLVEGDGFTRIVLLLRLRLAGFGVDFTSNGNLGLSKLRSCHPDVLLVELKLCGLSGLELIKAARAEPAFADKPIYVFTHVEKMSRAARKELKLLATRIFDKASISREALVQNFATEFLGWQSPVATAPQGTPGRSEPNPSNEMVLPGMLKEIVDGVREQSELLVKAEEPAARGPITTELLSRVSSLASCAEAAGLPALTRHAQALEQYLKELAAYPAGWTDTAPMTITKAIEAMHRISTDPKSEQKLSKFKAITVDESPASSQALLEALKKADFEPVSFTEPPLARAHLENNRTNVVVVNLVLPEAHGLALADIGRLPLHSQTAVVLGTESADTAHLGDRLPARSPSLDTETVMLAEFVLRALNEVQGEKTETPKGKSVKPTPVKPASPKAAPALPRVNVAAAFAGQDGFEMFARQVKQEDPAIAQTHTPLAAAPAESCPEQMPWRTPGPSRNDGASERPIRPRLMPSEYLQAEAPQFGGGSIISEAFLRAQPASANEDGQLRSLAPMPEAPAPDATHNEERPLEAFPTAGLPVEAPEAAEPETVDSQAGPATWLAAAAGEVEQTVPNQYLSANAETQEPAPSPLPEQIVQHDEEAMSHNLQSTSVQWGPAGDTRQLSPQAEGQSQEDLAARTSAAELALYEAQAEIARRDQAIEELEKQLAATAPHLATAEQSPGASAAEQAAQARCAELEQEVATLRQAFEHFDGNLGQEHQAATEAVQKVHELETKLQQATAQLQHAQAEAASHREAASLAGQESQTARQDAEARAGELEKQLDILRLAHQETAARLAQEQKARTEAANRIKHLEAQVPPAEDPNHPVPQAVAALAKVTAELAKERGERQRSEQRAADLNKRLQALHEDLRGHLKTQQEDQHRLATLEEQERQARLALEQRSAELEQLQDERKLAEQELEKQKDFNDQLRKQLSFYEGANKEFDGSRQQLQSRLEANLNAARENEARRQQEIAEQRQVSENLEKAKRDLQDEARKRQALQQELQSAQAALQERETKLQNETAERLRLKQALDAYQHNLQDGSERDLEISKLQSALHHEQLERQRQEAQVARMRRSAVDSANAARAVRTSLRRQIREPVDNLAVSAQTLLEKETGEEQRKLIEAVLRDVLLVQTRLRESEPAATPESSI